MDTRAKYFSTDGKTTHEQKKLIREQILEDDGNYCAYCGRKLSHSNLTMDHIIPLSKGGRSRKSNLVLCCKPCNQKKGNMDLATFLPHITNPNPPERLAKKVEFIKQMNRKAEHRETWGDVLEIAKQLHKKGIPGEAQKNRFSLFGCWVFHISGALDLCCDCGIKRIATDLTPHEMAMFINILKPKDIK